MTTLTEATGLDVPPVQMVGCGQCDAEPGEECRGPGHGWHLSRFDRMNEHRAAQLAPAREGEE